MTWCCCVVVGCVCSYDVFAVGYAAGVCVGVGVVDAGVDVGAGVCFVVGCVVDVVVVGGGCVCV